MTARVTDNSYDLDLDIALTLPRTQQGTIRCLESYLWITQSGLSEDTILAAGEAHRFENTDGLVIQALQSKARFVISTAPGRKKSLARAWRASGRQADGKPCSWWTTARSKIRAGFGAWRTGLG